MLRINILELNPSTQQRKILSKMLVRSSAIWNLGNYARRQAFFHKDIKSPSYYVQCKELKNNDLYKSLGSAYSQQFLKKLDKSWQSFWNSLKSENIAHKVSIPRYFKNYKTNQTLPKLLICRNDCYHIDRDYIYISCSKDLKEEYRRKGLMKIRYKGIRKWKGEQKAMEIKYIPYIKKFYAYQTEEVASTPIDFEEENICSIDLGIKRYLTTYIKTSEDISLIYESGHIFQEYLILSRRIASYQARAKNENNTYTTHRIRRLYLKRRRKLHNYLNNIVAHLFRKLKHYQVSKVVIGELKGIRDSQIPSYYKNKKKINEMIQNFWSVDLLKKKIKNKCEEFGVELVEVDEAYTSSTCPMCNKKVRPNDRMFKCPHCGYKQDRDVVGGINILKKYYHDHQIDDVRVENYPLVSTILIES
ncbi:MAG: RNA-guided endonuclease InsQ/TnpB family protein [Promethearchaeota archaeon]